MNVCACKSLQVLLGRVRPGRYPLWGQMYLRWWLATKIMAFSGRGIFNWSPYNII